MEQQQMEQQIQKLQSELVHTKSRSFEMISQSMSERDTLTNSIANLEKILSSLSTIVGLTSPSVDSLMKAVQSAMADSVELATFKDKLSKDEEKSKKKNLKSVE